MPCPHVKISPHITLGLLFIVTSSWLPTPLGSNVREKLPIPAD